MVKKIVLWVLVISCMATIFAFSSQNADDSTDLSDGILIDIVNFLKIDLTEQEMLFLSFFIRKTAHFTIYALLSSLIYTLVRTGYEKPGKLAAAISLPVSLLYAATDEVHQLFVADRSGQLTDVLLDFSGAVTGVVITWIIYIVVRRVKNG